MTDKSNNASVERRPIERRVPEDKRIPLSGRNKNGKPRVTVTVGEPIYPKECADKKELRDKIYWFMKNTAEEKKSYAYIEYIKKEESNENNDSL